jgi:hypothetical protein
VALSAARCHTERLGSSGEIAAPHDSGEHPYPVSNLLSKAMMNSYADKSALTAQLWRA